MSVRTVVSAAAASILGGILAMPASLGALAPVQPGVQVCKLVTLPGLSAQYSRALRELAVPRYRDPDAAPRTGAQADFQRVARGILGPGGISATPGLAGPGAGAGRVDGPTLADLPCDDGVRARDDVAWSMGLAGYSAREIAEVLEGVATVADLDDARSLRMSGASADVVDGFLTARKQELAAEVARANTPAPPPIVTTPLDSELIALAWRYGVSADLVRAVITAESNWNAAAVSSAGAIGLMQLMPATAAALGVNPWKPLENLRGGIAYLSGLLRSYGENARLALIAYHAGPQHANLVRDGRIVANAATQRYLAMIDARYRIR